MKKQSKGGKLKTEYFFGMPENENLKFINRRSNVIIAKIIMV